MKGNLETFPFHPHMEENSEVVTIIVDLRIEPTLSECIPHTYLLVI
jgi:hypothetical protein